MSATFLSIVALTVNVSPAGGGSVSGSGISCPGDCTEAYVFGASQVMTATPAAGFQFASWSGCDSPSGTSCTMSMTAAKSLTANFDAVPPPEPLTVTLNGSAFSTGQPLVVTVTLDPALSGPGPVDAYITVQIPGGQVFSVVQPIGANVIVPGTVPIATGFVPFAVTAPILSVPLSGIPPGSYTFTARLTQPGTSTVIGSASNASFTFTP